MRKHLWWIIGALLLFSITVISWKPFSAIKTNGTVTKNYTAKELFA